MVTITGEVELVATDEKVTEVPLITAEQPDTELVPEARFTSVGNVILILPNKGMMELGVIDKVYEVPD